MDKYSINIDDISISFPQNLSFNDEFSLDINQNNNNFSNINKINSKDFSSLIMKEPISSSFRIFKNDKLNPFNHFSDLISKDILNAKRNILPIYEDKDKNKNQLQKIKGNKKDTNENDIYFIDNLIRKAKRILLYSLLKYDNYIIQQEYGDNVGHGINIKKLFKINHLPIKDISTNFNKDLLKKTQGEILSSDISKRHTSYPFDHNKKLINKLLNEENEVKRKKFNDLFSKTLSECINHLIGKKKYEDLEGLDKFFENEIINIDEDEKYKESLKKVINNFETIFDKKKPRKRKLKNHLKD